MIYSRFHAALGDLLLCKNLTKECREKALNLLNYETGTATQGSDSRLRLNKRLNCIVFLFFTEEGLAGIKEIESEELSSDNVNMRNYYCTNVK